MSASWLLSHCQTNWSPLNAAATHQDATHDMGRQKFPPSREKGQTRKKRSEERNLKRQQAGELQKIKKKKR